MFFSMLKRDAGLFLRCLLPAAAFTLVFALVCAAAALSVTKGAEDVFTPVKAAVVDEEDSVTSRLLINVVKGTQYISSVLTVERMDREQADTALKTGEVAAVVVLPENFVADISGGAYSRGQIILSPAALSNADIVQMVARFGEVMLAAGQYAAIGGDTLILEQALGTSLRQDFLTGTNAALLSEAMEAGKSYFDVSVTEYGNTSMTPAAHYGISWTAFLLFLTAVLFNQLVLTDTSRSLLGRLRALGVSDGAFLFGKILYPFLFRIAILLAALPFAGKYLHFTLRTVCGAVAALLLASVIGTAITLFVKNAAAANIFLAIGGLFLCGGILPRQLMPVWLLFLGDITPLGASRALLAPLCGGTVSAAATVAVFFYAALSVWLCRLALRRKRVGGDVR